MENKELVPSDCVTDKEKYHYIVKTYEIHNYHDFIKYYKEIFNEDISQTTFARNSKKFNIIKPKKSDNSDKAIYYVEEKILTEEECIFNKYALKYVTDISYGKTGHIIINVKQGSEAAICQAIKDTFNFEHISLFPGFGSIFVLGFRPEVIKLHKYLKEQNIQIYKFSKDEVTSSIPNIAQLLPKRKK